LYFPFGSYEDPLNKEGLLNFVGDMLLAWTAETNHEMNSSLRLDHLGASLNVITGYHSLVVEGRVLTKNHSSIFKIDERNFNHTFAFNPTEVAKT
jgi:hypothetical protein